METRHRLENHLLSALGDLSSGRFIVGVSGGADSAALLSAMTRCRIDVMAVHCNFHLRGEESNRDMRFVQKLCNNLQIPLIIIHYDVDAYRKTRRVSLEMACRELRYSDFFVLAKKYGACRVAVAHNADDNAETLLLNLMRSTGIAGLRGMLPDTGTVIRPLLEISRREIVEYLDNIGQGYITDSSNLSSDYSRNFIRNEVLPLLATRWPSASQALCRTAANMRSEEAMLNFIENKYFDPSAQKLYYSVMLSHEERVWVVRRWATRLMANNDQAEEMVRCIESSDFISGKRWITPAGTIIAERDRFDFIPNDSRDRTDVTDGDMSSEISVSVERYRLTMDLMEDIRKAPLSELWISGDISDLYFRHWREGDRIDLLGKAGSAKVSKLLKDAKFSEIEKRRCVLACSRSDDTVIWVQKVKRSRHMLVETSSEYVYRIRIQSPDQSISLSE